MPQVASFFDPATYSFTHVLSDPERKRAAVIDPVADYDPATGQLCHRSAAQILRYLDAESLTVDWLLETHVHADHLSAGGWLHEQTKAPWCVSARFKEVRAACCRKTQRLLAAPGCSRFDRLLHHGDSLPLGSLRIRVMSTPGHTPSCLTFQCEDVAFVGDALFMPDFGTGRTDFPGGSARELYRSVKQILSLPDSTRLFVGHDYGHDNREGYSCETSVADQLEHNVHLTQHPQESSYVNFRESRDAGLPTPNLMQVAVPFNVLL